MIELVDRASTIFFDSAPLIYFIENHKKYCRLVEPIIESIAKGEKQGVSSFLTLMEILIKPFRVGKPDLADRYRNYLLNSPNMRLLPLEARVAEEAARIRAVYKFRTPDCIQLASAKLSTVDLFITNDKKLRGFKELQVLVLGEYTTKP